MWQVATSAVATHLCVERCNQRGPLQRTRLWHPLSAVKSFYNTHSVASGLLHGVQMVIYFFYKGSWVLPVAGFAVGYATNWVALKLVFEPAQPVNFGCFTLQGLFLKRQQQAAEVLADVSKNTFLAQELLWDEVFHGVWKDRWHALLQRVTDSFVRQRVQAGAAQRIASAMLLGEERLARIVRVARRPPSMLYAAASLS